jgi:chromosome segregation ATPase
MSEALELTKLRAQLEVTRAERDSASKTLEELQGEMEERLRLLTEEQDRFVSRLIDAYEQGLDRLRGELEEARAARKLLTEKLECAEREVIAAQENALDARSLIDKLRLQGDQAASVCRSLMHERTTLSGRTTRLEAELDMARTLLGFAMDGSDSHGTVTPPSPPLELAAERWRSSGVAPRNSSGAPEGSPHAPAVGWPQASRRKHRT